MILSGRQIHKEIDKGTISITDFNPKKLNPNSYNLKLHKELITYDNIILDCKTKHRTVQYVIPDDGYVLEPGILYLARTVELTRTVGFVPMIEGRSSLGRLGLFIHATAGFGDNGFIGHWTLELSVVQPLRIYAEMEICQIYYHTIFGDDGQLYDGKYQDNKGIQASQLHTEFN